MIDVFSISNGAVQAVNANIPATLMKSTGYTTSEDFQQVPQYNQTAVMVQVQAMTQQDLQHIDGLNIQGTMRKVYMYGAVNGASCPDATGGDLLMFPQTPDGEVQTWLVVQALETLPTWSALACTLQTDH